MPVPVSDEWATWAADEDYSECHNLAAEHRDKVIEMVGRWWAEAGKSGPRSPIPCHHLLMQPLQTSESWTIPMPSLRHPGRCFQCVEIVGDLGVTV